jgi:hypothetical protein
MLHQSTLRRPTTNFQQFSRPKLVSSLIAAFATIPSPFQVWNGDGETLQKKKWSDHFCAMSMLGIRRLTMWYAWKRVCWLNGVCLLASIGFTASNACGEEPPSAVDAIAAANRAVHEPVQLAYKFQPGQFVHYLGYNKIEMRTQLQGRLYDTSQHNETGKHFRVVSVDEQGVALIEPVMDWAKMSARMPDKGEVSFDSESKSPVQPQFRFIKETIGRPVARFQVAPTGELVKAIIVDTTAPAPMREAAQKLNAQFEFFVRLPKAPVKVGGKWNEDSSMTVTGGKGDRHPVSIRRVYELTAVNGDMASIKFKTLILTQLDDPELEKQVMQSATSGTIKFDIEKGLVRSYAANVNKTTLNAFGSESLMQIVGETTETLVLD